MLPYANYSKNEVTRKWFSGNFILHAETVVCAWWGLVFFEDSEGEGELETPRTSCAKFCT